jgi:hypothetical protein
MATRTSGFVNAGAFFRTNLSRSSEYLCIQWLAMQKGMITEVVKCRVDDAGLGSLSPIRIGIVDYRFLGPLSI